MRRRFSGFTLIELLVVIAIIAILAAILFPVFGKAKENAKIASCMSNLKQLGTATELYRDSFDGYYPCLHRYDPSNFGLWVEMLLPYTKNRAVFNCPAATAPAEYVSARTNGKIKVSYLYNECLYWNLPGTNFLLG